MPIRKEKTGCDEEMLLGYLEQRLSTAEETAMENHLEDCAACCRRIADAAADDALWSDAHRLLKADQWDGASSFSAAEPTPNPTEVDRQAALSATVREIKGWLDATDDPQMLGRFGGYEIVGIVGQGGMGVVLKGFEPSLNRYVAIKVLAPHLATSGAARQRFAREAQAAAAVLHENVISIHRVAASHDLPYLVMPYNAGVSLQKRIDDEGPLALPAILRISRQIAAGLAAAHAQGLVHRDIKPANILLERGVDRVTITDFGLARAVDDGSLTRTGAIAGTPQYMSPEQARGEAVDARSDLFSLGSLIYAMCAGHAPFRAETGYGILRRITDERPRPIREVNPAIPEWFEAIIRRLHAKSCSERFQTAAEVADLLQECLAHVQQPTVWPLPTCLRELVGASTRRRNRWLLTGACAVAVLTLGPLAGMYFLAEGGGSSRQEQTSEEQLPADPVRAAAGAKRKAAPLNWQGVSDESLLEFDRELSQFEDRSSRNWALPDPP